MTTIRMLMQVAAQYNMFVHQLDVKTAFLNAPIDHEVYVKQPDGFQETRKGVKLVWKLQKSLYGLKQSGRNWNFVLTEVILADNFKQSEVDPCLFVKKENNDNYIYIVIWVDDIVIATTSEALLNSTKDMLKRKFNIKDLGEISYFLGIEFELSNGGILMGQSHYIKHILERFDMTDCKPRATPCEAKLEAYEKTVENTAEDIKRYREIVGSLIYVMVCTRPDLSFVVTRLSQNLEKPTEGDWITIKHV